MEQHNQEIGTRRDLVLYRLETPEMIWNQQEHYFLLKTARRILVTLVMS